MKKYRIITDYNINLAIADNEYDFSDKYVYYAVEYKTFLFWHRLKFKYVFKKHAEAFIKGEMEEANRKMKEESLRKFIKSWRRTVNND